ncbi:MAG TPA: c-type cytochrome [Steroidobacteraceae bacterium]|nr:c-type cytochrome [Steroidobacteraceae bacterium]
MRLLAAASLCIAAAGAVASRAAPPGTASPVAASAMPTGDAARGRQIFAPCRTCHYPEKGYGHHNGPSLFAIFGRRAGTQQGFPYYSEALKRSNLVWTPELLNAWLANPTTFIPGTDMVFVAIPGAQDRADLIAYLAQFHDP